MLCQETLSLLIPHAPSPSALIVSFPFISLNRVTPPPPPLPSHSFFKPPITHVFCRHPKDPTTLPSSPPTLVGPDELAIDYSNNTIDESPIISDELQVGS